MREQDEMDCRNGVRENDDGRRANGGAAGAASGIGAWRKVLELSCVRFLAPTFPNLTSQAEQTMRFAATCFEAFAALVVVTIVSTLWLAPKPIDLAFVASLLTICGGIAFCSGLAAWQLWSLHSPTLAYSLIAALTGIIVIGWLQTGSVELDEPIHPVLHALRVIDGVSVLVLWPVLIGAHFHKQ